MFKSVAKTAKRPIKKKLAERRDNIQDRRENHRERISDRRDNLQDRRQDHRDKVQDRRQTAAMKRACCEIWWSTSNECLYPLSSEQIWQSKCGKKVKKTAGSRSAGKKK